MRSLFISGVLLLVLGCASSSYPEYGKRHKLPEKLETHLDPDEEILKPETGDSSSNATEKKETDLNEGPVRLSTLLELGEARNQKLRAARNQWQSAWHRSGAVSGMPDPSLMVKVAAEPVQTRDGPVNAMTGISQRIPWPGSLDAREKAALAHAGMKAANYREQKLSLRTELTRSATGLYYLRSSLEIVNENIELLNRLESAAETRYRNDLTPYQDVLKIQIQQDQLKEERDNLKDRIRSERTKLNGLLDRPAGSSIGAIQLPEVREVSVEEKTLLKEVVDEQPGIARAGYAVLRAEQKLREAEIDPMPDPIVGAEYSFVGHTGKPGTVDAGSDAYQFSLGFTLPIWQEKYREAIRSEKTNLRSARRKFREAVNRARTEVSGSYASFQTALRERETLKEQIIPRARQALSSSETSYRDGEIEIMGLIDSQQKLLRFRRSLIRARKNIQVTRKELEEALGTPLSNDHQ